MDTRNTHEAPAEGKCQDEAEAFQALQACLPDLYRKIFPDRLEPRTVVIMPSLSMDGDVLARITGVHHYEERLLCLLLLLRLPRTRVIYLTSTPIADPIIDYYLHLLPGVPYQHARERLTLLSCHDASLAPLTRKILDRPRLLDRIEQALGDKSLTHMVCFNVSPIERTLAVRLGIPIYGCDPDLLPLGSKSGGRALFREAGVEIVDGAENLAGVNEVARALADLKARNPDLGKAVVKLNEGFSGEGNAVFRFDGAPAGAALEHLILDQLPDLAFEASGMTWDIYAAKLEEMGGIVEAFIEGEDKRSPSVQFRINPTGRLEPISTHDQVLGGKAAQVFLGCIFPADDDYRMEIQAEGMKAARVLLDRGVLGRFGIDFLSVREGDRWRHYAIEINLRKGGTTHPLLMLRFLTDGTFDPGTGAFVTPDGCERFYYATDNLESERYKGLTPDDLIDIAVEHDIHFHGVTQRGVVFHLIGALSEFGKLGVVCVGESHAEAFALYRRTVEILDREGGEPA